jgi:hypothetical protein
VAAVYTIQANNRIYTVVDDLTMVYLALITGVITGDFVDDGAEEPLRTSFVMHVERKGVFSKIIEGGLFCVAGYPEQVFPNIHSAGDSVELVFTAPGYRERRLTIPIPKNASFPVRVPQAILLRPLLVRIRGQVVMNTIKREPISGARIISVSSTSATKQLVALGVPLQFGHVQNVAVNELNPVGPIKKMLSAASRGTRVLTLSNRTGLLVGSVLRIPLSTATQMEYTVVDDPGPSPQNTSGNVKLRSPLAHEFPKNTQVERLAATSLGKLAREADAGDGMLILDKAPAPAVESIEIADPTRVEYRDVGAVTDANGIYQLEGISRVRTIPLQASTTSGLPVRSQSVSRTINYEQPVNIVNFQL